MREHTARHKRRIAESIREMHRDRRGRENMFGECEDVSLLETPEKWERFWDVELEREYKRRLWRGACPR